MKTIQCAHPFHHHNGFVATCRLWAVSAEVHALLYIYIIYTYIYIERERERKVFNKKSTLFVKLYICQLKTYLSIPS